MRVDKKRVKIMKIIILIIGLACLPLIFNLVKDDNPELKPNNDPVSIQNSESSIVFLKTTYDFGDIKEADGSVTHTFEFTNNGNSPLIVQDVKSSCGCTTPDWTREPVKPGEKGTITAEYNP